MLDRIFREDWGRVLASLVGYLRDIELAEEAAQEAFTIAAERWPREGIPVNPTGWLIATGRNRAIDRIRRERTWTARRQQLEHELRDRPQEPAGEVSIFPDERLELIFTCCHPALALDAQVALTLRTLGGLSTDSIARAFLVPFETMSKRLTRAKHKIRDARIPFAIPAGHLLPERLDAVLAVVYLIFNEGWSDGDCDLATEAINLGRALVELMPDEAEAHALLSLMLLGHARHSARFAGGELVLLDDQDRSRWNAEEIEQGRVLLERALSLHGSGTYTLQAAIADLHLREPRDWGEIALLYRRLEEITSSPVVTMNRAIAVAELEGAQAALALVDRLALEDYRYYHSTRGELLRRAGRNQEARAAYRLAIELSGEGPEQRFLRRRLEELGEQNTVRGAEPDPEL